MRLEILVTALGCGIGEDFDDEKSDTIKLLL